MVLDKRAKRKQVGPHHDQRGRADGGQEYAEVSGQLTLSSLPPGKEDEQRRDNDRVQLDGRR
jgi:hypothetical protein